MFTRLHLKQEPHHDSARPDDWEGRNRNVGYSYYKYRTQTLSDCHLMNVDSNANFVGPLDSTLHCNTTCTDTGILLAKYTETQMNLC